VAMATVCDERRPGGVLCFKTGLDTRENARRVCRMNAPDKALPDNAIRNTKYRWCVLQRRGFLRHSGTVFRCVS
jgi:hypothetical protein